MGVKLILAIVLAVVAWCEATATLASTIASDNASAAAYNAGWTTGMNGGSGFGPWQLAVSNPGNANFNGHFIGASTVNGNGLDEGNIGGVAGDTDIDSTLSSDSSNVTDSGMS